MAKPEIKFKQPNVIALNERPDEVPVYLPPIDDVIEYRDPELRKVEKLYNLTHHELRILHARLKLPAATQQELAAHLGVSAGTIGQTLARPHVKDALLMYSATDMEKLQGVRSKAVEVLTELLDSPKDNVRLQAAKTVLLALPSDADQQGGDRDSVDEQAAMFSHMIEATLGSRKPKEESE